MELPVGSEGYGHSIMTPHHKGTVSDDVIRNLRRKVHQTLASVTRDFEQLEFNTIISALMELMNEMVKAKQAGAASSAVWNEALELYALMLAPISPHMAEELWMKLGQSIFHSHTILAGSGSGGSGGRRVDTGGPGEWKAAGSDHSSDKYFR